MKNYAKILIALSALALACAANANVVIGNWQGTGDDGWIDNGNSLSITNAANMPSKYAFAPGVVTGYAQSLQVNQAGFGNNLKYNFNPADILGNHVFSFTFSVPPAGTNTSGYNQIYSVAFNSSSGGYTNVPWSLWSGNGGNQPNFYFYAGAPARSVTVSLDYSFWLTNAAFATSSWFQVTFTGNTGGGAPAYYYMNNVVLSGPIVPTIIVDQFNPTNNPYSGTNDYNAGYITNQWITNWFGDALTGLSWDSSMDAGGGAAGSGSMKLVAQFGTNGGGQWIVHDDGVGFARGFSPPITNGYGLQTFECDVRYDPSSPTRINGGATNYGHLEFGTIPGYTGQNAFGTADVDVTNTGWVHLVIPLTNAVNNNPDLLSIQGVWIKQNGSAYGALQGTSTLWVDNLKFTYAVIPPVIAPPTVRVQKAVPALRLFAGDPASLYTRAELLTTDNQQSWLGGSFPVTYSFTIRNYPTSVGQTHIFLIPDASMNGAADSYNGIDYTATNGLWMTLNPGPTNGSAVCQVSWKVNLPNQNPYQVSAGGHVALQFTNPVAVGTWTLRFNTASTGAVIAPDSSSHSFTITNANVSTDFANPLHAYFGLQANQSSGQGQYEDWTSIQVTGVAGTHENTDFTTATSLTGWEIMPQPANVSAVHLVTTTTPYWVNWDLPADGYDLVTAMDVAGNTNTFPAGLYPWVLPEYYNNYNDGLDVPGTATQGGTRWVLLPVNCLPTSDGQPGGPLSPTAFFRAVKPAPLY